MLSLEVVRMRFFLLILVASFSLFQSVSIAADSRADLVARADGNRIQEPLLKEYVRANRTPELSEITDVVDQDGQPVTSN